MCGHATLATAHVMMEIRHEVSGRVAFESRSGELVVTKDGDLYALDFPARPPVECKFDPKLFDALGAKPKLVLGARDLFCVFESEAEVRALKPNMERLAAYRSFRHDCYRAGLGLRFCVAILCARAGHCGGSGDGVGALHADSILVGDAGKEEDVRAADFSAGGEIWCEDRGARVTIAGKAAKYLEGTIVVS